jgi:hypothetical protein
LGVYATGQLVAVPTGDYEEVRAIVIDDQEAVLIGTERGLLYYASR